MKNDKLSLCGVLIVYFRGFKILYQFMPQYLLSRSTSAAWNALTPYVGIYLSALILQELAGACNPETLISLVLITLLSAALISLGNAIISRWRDAVCSTWYNRWQLIHIQKLLSMDFCAIDDVNTQQSLDSINRQRMASGAGLIKLRRSLKNLVSAILSILGGIALTITLFTSKVPETAGVYTVLNHPLFLVTLIAVMFFVIYLSPMLYTKSNNLFLKHLNESSTGNLLFEFYLNRMRNKNMGTDIRLYRQERMTLSFFTEGIFSSKGMFAKLQRSYTIVYEMISDVITVIFTGITYAFVCLKAWAGAFGVGEITQYLASIAKVSSGVSTLLLFLGDMRTNAPYLKNELAFLDIPNKMYQGSLTVEKRRDRNYEIEFKNVSFKYPGAHDYALRNVSIKFRVGQRLAVVGMNGSGKTTFIKLLCRLYDPTEGVILLNGIDIRKYNYLDYMSIFSVVFQDFNLFSFKLGENVAGSATYDKNRVIDCLVKAGFKDRLNELPKGIDTYLYKHLDKDGVDFSGGELQKIALARTLYKDAPFIILDEPTAALDPIAEAEVYTKFNDIISDKTAIYISHRLSSCRFCDEVVVFDHGSVVQQGSHDTLVLDENGKYHELWHAQAQYYA